MEHLFIQCDQSAFHLVELETQMSVGARTARLRRLDGTVLLEAEAVTLVVHERDVASGVIVRDVEMGSRIAGAAIRGGRVMIELEKLARMTGTLELDFIAVDVMKLPLRVTLLALGVDMLVVI